MLVLPTAVPREDLMPSLWGGIIPRMLYFVWVFSSGLFLGAILRIFRLNCEAIISGPGYVSEEYTV